MAKARTNFKAISMRTTRAGMTRVWLPERMLHKQYKEVEVRDWTGAWHHIRQVKRWMPLYDIQAWLNEHAGKTGWEMVWSTREIEFSDPNVAFLFRLRWS